MSRTFLLVDAHNVIFARPDLADLHRRGPAAAREALIRLLERHQDAAGVRVVAVFDGGAKGRGAGELSAPAGIQIFYTQSADSIIERLAVKYAAKHRIVVATNDTLVRTAAEAAGATTLDVDTLFGEIERVANELESAIRKLRPRR